MRITCNRQRLVIALTAVLVGFVLPARPFGIVGVAQSIQQAAIGARLMRGAVDLHYLCPDFHRRTKFVGDVIDGGSRGYILQI